MERLRSVRVWSRIVRYFSQVEEGKVKNRKMKIGSIVVDCSEFDKMLAFCGRRFTKSPESLRRMAGLFFVAPREETRRVFEPRPEEALRQE